MADEVLEKHDAGLAYFMRTRHHDEETALILKGHLLVEFLLDKLIEEKLRDTSNIRKYRFSVKLQILYSMRLLSEQHFKNITQLNAIRNKLMHNLEVDAKSLRLTVHGLRDMPVPLPPRRKGGSMRYPVRMLCYVTLDQLAKYMRRDLGMDFELPSPNWT